MKSKTASIRLSKEMFEEIDELCDNVGCSRNDWIKDKLKDGLREENNEIEDPEPKEETKPKELPKILKGVIIDDITEKKLNVIPGILIDDNGKQTELTKGSDGVLRPKTEESKEFIPNRITAEVTEVRMNEEIPNWPATFRSYNGELKLYSKGNNT